MKRFVEINQDESQHFYISNLLYEIDNVTKQSKFTAFKYVNVSNADTLKNNMTFSRFTSVIEGKKQSRNNNKLKPAWRDINNEMWSYIRIEKERQKNKEIDLEEKLK